MVAKRVVLRCLFGVMVLTAILSFLGTTVTNSHPVPPLTELAQDDSSIVLGCSYLYAINLGAFRAYIKQFSDIKFLCFLRTQQLRTSVKFNIHYYSFISLRQEVLKTKLLPRRSMNDGSCPMLFG